MIKFAVILAPALFLSSCDKKNKDDTPVKGVKDSLEVTALFDTIVKFQCQDQSGDPAWMKYNRIKVAMEYTSSSRGSLSLSAENERDNLVFNQESLSIDQRYPSDCSGTNIPLKVSLYEYKNGVASPGPEGEIDLSCADLNNFVRNNNNPIYIYYRLTVSCNSVSNSLSLAVDLSISASP